MNPGTTPYGARRIIGTVRRAELPGHMLPGGADRRLRYGPAALLRGRRAAYARHRRRRLMSAKCNELMAVIIRKSG